MDQWMDQWIEGWMDGWSAGRSEIPGCPLTAVALQPFRWRWFLILSTGVGTKDGIFSIESPVLCHRLLWKSLKVAEKAFCLKSIQIWLLFTSTGTCNPLIKAEDILLILDGEYRGGFCWASLKFHCHLYWRTEEGKKKKDLKHFFLCAEEMAIWSLFWISEAGKQTVLFQAMYYLGRER